MNEKNGASTTTLSFRGGERDKAALERAQLAEHKLNFDKLQRSSVIISKSLLELCSKMNISKSVQVSNICFTIYHLASLIYDYGSYQCLAIGLKILASLHSHCTL